jgi:hypothetical protein
MTHDGQKDFVEAAIAAALVIPGGAVAAVVAAAPPMISVAWQRMQSRRADKWWQCVCKADDGGKLQRKIEDGLLNESEHVIAGVVEGARARMLRC